MKSQLRCYYVTDYYVTDYGRESVFCYQRPNLCIFIPSLDRVVPVCTEHLVYQYYTTVYTLEEGSNLLESQDVLDS